MLKWYAQYFSALMLITACYAGAKSNYAERLFKADPDDFSEIYDKRFAEAANAACREHDQRLLAGCTTTDIPDYSFDTDTLTSELYGLGYRIRVPTSAGPCRMRVPKRRR